MEYLITLKQGIDYRKSVPLSTFTIWKVISINKSTNLKQEKVSPRN